MSFAVGFTQLTTIKRPVKDQWPEITDVKAWVVAYLEEADSRQEGKLKKFAEARLDAQVRLIFAEYLPA